VFFPKLTDVHTWFGLVQGGAMGISTWFVCQPAPIRVTAST
jgi:hypothetical protein